MEQASSVQDARAYPLTFRVLFLLCLGAILALAPAGLTAARVRPFETALWIIFLMAANLVSLPALPRGALEVSVSAPIAIATVVLLPPPLAALVNFLGLTNEREFKRPFPLVMSLFNRSQIGLSAGLAGFAIHAIPGVEMILGTVLAVIIYNFANAGFVTAALWARRRLGLSAAARGTTAPFPRFAVDFGLVMLLALFIVVAHDSVGAWAVLLVAMPLWLGFNALKSAREAEDRAEELADRVRELETLNAAATEFLTARQVDHAALIASGALSRALDTDDVEVGFDGVLAREHLQAVEVPGAEPVVVGVPAGLSGRSLVVAEAIAGLLGMSLVRQHLEQELAEVQRARAALSGRILEEGTRERSRIALEIHDDVLPSFAATQIQADNVRSALQVGAYDRAAQIAQSAHDAAQSGITHLRQVLDDLHRQIVVPGGLRPGLVAALGDLRLQHGVEGRLRAPAELPELPLAIEILALETVRGCLVNVARHAQASAVELALEMTDRAIQLEVRDDGKGFEPATVEEGHQGLALMAQRVELARGRFVVTSAPGEGTLIRIEVPV